VLALILDLADQVTDVFTCTYVLTGDIWVPDAQFKVAYVAFMCTAALGAIVSVGYRIQNARLFRSHVRALAAAAQHKQIGSYAEHQTEKYMFEVKQIHRQLVTCALHLATLVAEGDVRTFTFHLDRPVATHALNSLCRCSVRLFERLDRYRRHGRGCKAKSHGRPVLALPCPPRGVSEPSQRTSSFRTTQADGLKRAK
jgi:hypothetical protein